MLTDTDGQQLDEALRMIERLKHLREILGWSQAFVATMLRVSRGTLSRWERGAARPRTSNQEKIEALVRCIEKVPVVESSPEVEIRVGEDVVGGDKFIGRDSVGGDVITTTDGTTYVLRGNLIIVVDSPEALSTILAAKSG